MLPVPEEGSETKALAAASGNPRQWWAFNSKDAVEGWPRGGEGCPLSLPRKPPSGPGVPPAINILVLHPRFT